MASLDALLRQAVAAHEHEHAELVELRAEVTRLRAELKNKVVASGNGCGAGESLMQSSSPAPTIIVLDGQEGARPAELQQQQQQQQQQLQIQQQPIDASPPPSDASLPPPLEGAQLPKSGSGTSARRTAFSSLQEDDEEDMTLAEKLLDGPLECVTSILILANCLMILVQQQYLGHAVGVQLGLATPGVWPQLDMTFQVLEHTFNAFFIIELLIRLIAFRGRFFYDGCIMKYNLLDMGLVLFLSADLYIFVPIVGMDMVNFSIIRIVRLLRLTRTLRALDGVKVFMPLRMLMNAIIASVSPLFWSIVLLIIVMFIASLVLVQALQAKMLDGEAVGQETREWMFRHYGTPAMAYYTVFEFTFSGGWPNYARRLVEEVSYLYAPFFMVYIIFVVFTLFRIITAIFLKDTMALAAKDAELAVQQKMHQKKEFAENLKTFFEAADTSGDGLVTKAEFDEIISNEKVKVWLNMLELSLNESEELFTVIAGEDGFVSYDEFSKGVLQLRGPARSEDVMSLKRQGSKVLSDVDHLSRAVNTAVDGLREDIQALHGNLEDMRIKLALPLRSL